MSADSASRNTTAQFILITVLALTFALSYTQEPLYSDNQHSHMLRGLAEGGYGHLSGDWLANTADPFPVFSFVVANTYRVFGEAPFYLYQLLIYAAYFLCWIFIADALFGLRRSVVALLIFAAVVIFLHSALASDLFISLTGQDIGRELHHGVALQYMINKIFQPSSFSVLLLVSIALFLNKRHLLSAIALGACAAIYFSLALGSAILFAGYATALVLRDRDWKSVLYMGGLAAVIALPTALYVVGTFAPSNAEAFEQMQRLFFEVRFPQHANPTDWWNEALPKLVWVALALWLVRKSRLFPIMAISTAGVVLLTLGVVFTGSRSLALLFPWRLSVLLVPLASIAILGEGVQWLIGKRDALLKAYSRWVVVASVVVCLSAVGWGIWTQLQLYRERDLRPENGVYAYLHENAAPDDIYLVPYGIGGFRLGGGAPIFVDLKSHPYHDVGVVEWDRRIEAARALYDGPNPVETKRILELHRRWPVTHAVMPTAIPVYGEGAKIIYADEHYVVYLLR